MNVRIASLNDAAGIARVHVDTWRTTYRGHLPDDYLDRLSYERRERMWQNALTKHQDKSFVYVIESDTGEIVGFCACGRTREDGDPYAGEIYAIYVLDEHQGKGMGKRLFLAAVERLLAEGMRSMMLWVLRENDASRSFYEALGGVVYDEKRDEIGGKTIVEVAYGWADLAAILPPS